MIRHILLFLFVCLSVSFCHSQDANFHIYLAFGQSNMEGQGIIEDVDTIAVPNFLMLQTIDCPNLNRVRGNWYSAIPPICNCTSGLGPIDYFGRTMVENLPDSITIGVLNVAIGGCDIRLFDKDIYSAYDSTYMEDWFINKVKSYNGNPYQYLVDLAKIAQRRGVIKGILLHQGETNTGDQMWPQYVEKIYSDLLIDLKLDPHLVPILAGEVVSDTNSCCASMNEIINQLPNAIETAYIISSDGCTFQDQAHFDSAGYREMGKRYAIQMLELQN